MAVGLLAVEMFGSLGFVYEKDTGILYVRVVLPRGAVIARACKPDLSTERSRLCRLRKKLGALIG